MDCYLIFWGRHGYIPQNSLNLPPSNVLKLTYVALWCANSYSDFMCRSQRNWLVSVTTRWSALKGSGFRFWPRKTRKGRTWKRPMSVWNRLESIGFTDFTLISLLFSAFTSFMFELLLIETVFSMHISVVTAVLITSFCLHCSISCSVFQWYLKS